MKFLLKPSNQKVDLDPEKTTISQIFNSRNHTASLSKTGKPIGPDYKLLKDCDLVANDFLWKIEKPDLSLEDFVEYLTSDLVDEKRGVQNLEINQNINDRTATVEFLNAKEDKKPLGSVCISNNRNDKLNIMIEIDTTFEAEQYLLNFETLERMVYQLKCLLGQTMNLKSNTGNLGFMALPESIVSKIVEKVSYLEIGESYRDLLQLSMANKTLQRIVNCTENDVKLFRPHSCKLDHRKELDNKDWQSQLREIVIRIRNDEKRRKAVRDLHESQRSMPNPLRDTRESSNPFSTPFVGQFPGMIGGVRDLDPFAGGLGGPSFNPATTPRGDPNIYGPGSNMPQPGPSRGLGSDDDVYTQPGFPRPSRGPNRRLPGGFSGRNPFSGPFGGNSHNGGFNGWG